MRERWSVAALAMALVALAGCAALMPVTTPPAAPPETSAPSASTSTPPAPATPAPAPSASSATTTGMAPPAPAAIDSTRVSEAGRAVLATIPEPLAPGERVPAPPAPATTPAPAPVGMPAPEAAYDTLRATVPPPGAGTDGDVPVPTPTQPLGDKPGTLQRLLAPDTSASSTPTTSAPPASAPPATSTRPAAKPAPPASTSPSSAAPAAAECWRVQVGAPAEQARAESLRKAAESQLLVPFVVEREKGLYKVRTASCVSGEAADALKRRASLAGFTGVFRFVGGTR